MTTIIHESVKYAAGPSEGEKLFHAQISKAKRKRELVQANEQVFIEVANFCDNPMKKLRKKRK